MTATKQGFSTNNDALHAIDSLHKWIRAFDKQYRESGAGDVNTVNEALREIDLRAGVLKERVVSCGDSAENWEQECANLWHSYSDLDKRFREYERKYKDKPVGAHGDFQKVKI